MLSQPQRKVINYIIKYYEQSTKYFSFFFVYALQIVQKLTIFISK